MGKYTKQSDYIGKWSTKDKFQKDPGYTYMEIPRYFKVGTVSNVNKTIDSFVAKMILYCQYTKQILYKYLFLNAF